MSVGTEQQGLKQLTLSSTLTLRFILVTSNLCEWVPLFSWFAVPAWLPRHHALSIRGASKQDEALECYGRAANMYKMAKKWSAAGNTFCTIANHHIKVVCYGTNSPITNTVLFSLAINMTQPPTLWTQPIATRRTTLKKLQQVCKRSLS